MISEFDVAGVGLNATDTLLMVPRFPPYAGKMGIEQEVLSPGGQVASALVACAKLGLRTRYIGSVGDDQGGRIQTESLRAAGIDIRYLQTRENCPNQSAYIVIDRSTGERTIFWRRDSRLYIPPEDIRPEHITGSRLLLVDGHDTATVARAADIAGTAGIPVVADIDTIYPGLENLLRHVNYLVGSSEFPGGWTGENDPFRALPQLQNHYGMTVAAMTLGSDGALAYAGGEFFYSPAFVVSCVDTTGAGDVFHGAFCYAVLQGMSLPEALEFSNAMAALNCTAYGARGGIQGLDAVRALMIRGERRTNEKFAAHASLKH